MSETPSLVSAELLQHVPSKCAEGLALALADKDDGAVMVFHWCNKAFCQITGYAASETIGQRGTLLIGPDMEQGVHLLIIDKLMNWECFSVTARTNRKTGAPYWVTFYWTPIAEAQTGNRWWLVSLIELETPPATLPMGKRDHTAAVAAADTETSVRHVEEIARLEKENRRLQDLAQSVARESNEDALTGLSNRRHFEVEIQAWTAALAHGGPEFAVLYIDLDRFKSVNDTLGHEAGDKLLVSVANTLRRVSDPGDLLARLGGDEFVILKPLGTTALNISGLADQITEEMSRPFTFEGKSVACSASVGVAIADATTRHPEQIVADADTALYQAKAHGRGRWSFFTAEMHAEAIAMKRLANELLMACEAMEFVPFFQPLIDARTGRIASAEALVRWHHPARGILTPDRFLDVAAKIGVLNRIDEIMFDRLREALQFFDKGDVCLPRVALNVSAGRLQDPSFILDIKSSGINPARLTVEILESVYLEDLGDIGRWTLDELDDLGVTVAVDDFGTGHASIQGLLKIKPEILKIDRQFIKPIVDDTMSRELVTSIIHIGKVLGKKIVAEGVETADHARIATDMGCDYLQGYFFGKPMSAADLRARMERCNGVFWRGAAMRDDRRAI